MERPDTPLLEEEVDRDPVRQFRLWFEEAEAAGIPLPHAMTLATATPDGRPSIRSVLLKEVDERGFAFYTNYESRKAEELDANPRAAAAFRWVELEREVRIEGTVERVSPEDSDRYFATRPRESRLSAWSSPQSRPIERAELERRTREVATAHRGHDVPRPPHWGGYRILPEAVELWQGRPDRLHDRLRYVREVEGWRLERLAP